MIAFLPHFFLLSLALASSSLPQPEHGGFSVELIHRDSPKSPFYNPSKTPSQRLADAVTRSISRVNRFKLALTCPNPPPQVPVIPDDGEYIMKFSLGTPPTEILGILDTGSDLTWTQCKPCPGCYKQKTPLFNPNASSTYKQIPCNSTKCESIGSSCDDNKDICQYSISYGDGSYSEGDLAMDTLTLNSTGGQSISIDKTIWGCGHHDGGVFTENEMGIVGLGATPASLIRQKGSELGGQKFSYCLAPSQQSTSTLNFGNAGVVSGPGVVSTPLIINGPFYQVTLEAVSVGNERFDLQEKLSTEGNIVVDSGSTLTYLLDQELYDSVKSALEKEIQLQPAPSVEGLDCYYNSTVFEAPIITMHLDGADLKLSTLNTFLQHSENTTCFAFRPYGGLIGNIAQMNFLVGYDLERKTLSFKSTDCSK